MHKKGKTLPSIVYDALQLNFFFQNCILSINRPSKYCVKFLMTLLDCCLSFDFDCVVVLGNFNIHVDNPQDSSTKELFCILYNKL